MNFTLIEQLYLSLVSRKQICQRPYFQTPICTIIWCIFQGKACGDGFLIMINYIYNQLYNLQGWFVRVSDSLSVIKSLFFLSFK